MALLNFKKSKDQPAPIKDFNGLLNGFSMEIMPRTAEKVESFANILPKDTLIYIAHIDGTSIDDMVRTAVRLGNEGFKVMPHFPARIIKDKPTLSDWIDRYVSEAGVKQALLLAGGIDTPKGSFDSSMQLLETELFDKYGFTDLNVAGHPEGNKDIDPDNTNKNVDMALEWKQKFSERTDANMGITTQFAFDSVPIFEWANRINAAGITLPINVGVAGPAKLQTLIKFAIACGVGPSLKVLQKRALDLTKLLLPYEPTEVLEALATGVSKNPNANISSIHFFPLGGIKTNAEWISNNLTKNIKSA